MCDERPNVCAAELKGPPTLLHLLYKNIRKRKPNITIFLLVIVIGSMRLHRA